MAEQVRVRFAPSPTGPLHIGGVRTALFNYLFAKKHGGKFLLRIEDTDQTRYVEGAENYIIESLEWLQIPFDEGPGKEGDCGPYRQSERKALYEAYAQQLIQEGSAYYAFDTPEELSKLRASYESQAKTFIYNWHNRKELNNSLNLSSSEVDSRLKAETPYVIRFKTPENKSIQLTDIVRGSMTIDSNTLDDKVLFKSDGMPTYHLANIVDDHLMRISHVIRGEEWLPSLALHVMLYEAFGWKVPSFAHLPLIMKPTGKGKLSKRDGEAGGFPVYPLEWKTEKDAYMGYREEGYFPEAVVNMLALLGWNPGTEKEIFSLQELIEIFDLSRVNKAGAKFDPEKTKWFQHHYLQEKDESVLVTAFEGLLQQKGVSKNNHEAQIVAMIKERATFVSDLWDQASFFYEAPKEFDEKASKKAFKEDTTEIIQSLIDLLQNSPSFESEELSSMVKGWITDQGMGFGKVMMPLRLSLVGEMKGPDVFDILSVLGKDESINRLQFALSKMS